MARTPKRLAGPALLTNAAATKYTCPALTKTEVRHMRTQNPSASPVTFSLSIGNDAAATRLFDAQPIAANGEIDRFVYWVLDAAEVIQAFASTNNVLTLTLDGVEITLG
jgi:hypothetical protein